MYNEFWKEHINSKKFHNNSLESFEEMNKLLSTLKDVIKKNKSLIGARISL